MKNKTLAHEKILTNSKQQDSEKNQLTRTLFFFQYDGNGLGKRNLQEKEFVLPVIHLKKFFFLLFLQYPSRIPCPKPNFIFHFVL